MRKLDELTVRSGSALSNEARQAMAAWIQDVAHWEVFATVTFRPPDGQAGYTQRGHAYCWRQGDLLLSWLRGVSPDWSLKSFLVEERHESGVPHLHGLVGRARGCLPLQWDKVKEIESRMSERVGWTSLRAYDSERCGPEGKTGCVAYVSKYVCKGGGLSWRLSL